MNIEQILHRRREELNSFLKDLGEKTVGAVVERENLEDFKAKGRALYDKYKFLTLEEKILLVDAIGPNVPTSETNSIETSGESPNREILTSPETYQKILKGSSRGNNKALVSATEIKNVVNQLKNVSTNAQTTLDDFEGMWLANNRASDYENGSFFLFFPSLGIQFSLFQGSGYPFNTFSIDRNYQVSTIDFKLQPDGSIKEFLVDSDLVATLNGDKTVFYAYSTAEPRLIYRFDRVSEIPPQVIQYLERPAEVDWANNQTLFRYYNEYILKYQAPYALESMNSPGFNYNKSLTIMEKLLSGQKIKRYADIVNVWKTTRPETAAITTLLTAKEHRFNSASKVCVSGFQGEYEILNGEWPVIGITWSFRNYPKGFVDKKSQLFMIDIPVDTSSLPRYRPNCHGCGKIKSTLKPVNSDSSYRQLIDAINFSMVERGIHTHDVMLPIAQLKAQGTLNIQTLSVMETYSDFYLLPSFTLVCPSRNHPTRQIVPNYFGQSVGLTLINNPKNYDFNFLYPITMNNYLLNPEDDKLKKYRIKKVQWSIAGPVPPSPPYNFLYGILDLFGYPANGSKFIFRIADYKEPDSQMWRNLVPTNDPHSDYYIALVNPDYTNGKNVGYLAIKSVISADPLYLMVSPYFNLENVLEPDKISYGLTFRRLFGTLMNYMIQEWKIESLIVDNRANSGGFTQIVMAIGSTTGGDRKFFNDQSVFPDGSQYGTPSWTDAPPEQASIPPTPYFEPVIKPSQMESEIPNSVFRGTPGKTAEIVFLTSIYAVSEGDSIAQNFLGDDALGNLGHNTHSTTIGNIDGRFDGSSGENVIPQNIAGQNPLITPLGDSVLPFTFNGERVASFFSEVTGKYMTEFENALKPTVLEGFGLEELYQDTGYKPSSKPYLNDVVPIKGDLSTYRDSSFEDSIVWLTRPDELYRLHGQLQ